MSDDLTKTVFTDEDWEDVRSFDCGSDDGATEVSNWLKGPPGEDSAITAIHRPDRPARVWLYWLDEELVGSGALGKSEWRWKKKKDPKIPVTVLLWFGLHKDFHRQPDGPKENRYAARILNDLIAEAFEDRETHPVMGLCVRPTSIGAIKLYREANFTEEFEEPYRDRATGIEYKRMALILDPQALLRIRDAAMK